MNLLLSAPSCPLGLGMCTWEDNGTESNLGNLPWEMLSKGKLKSPLQILAKYIWWGDVPVKRFFKSIKYTANTGSLGMGSSEPQGDVPTTEFLHSDRWTQLDEIDWLEFLTKILEKSRRGSCSMTATIGRRSIGRDPRSARKKGNTIISQLDKISS